MKQCSKCLIIKDFLQFHSALSNKDGYSTKCKICINELYRQRYSKKVENYISLKDRQSKIKEYSRICNRCNIEKDYEFFDRAAKETSGYATICKQCRSIEKIEYRSRPEVKEKRKIYEVSDIRRTWKRKKHNEKIKNDILYKIKWIVRNRIRVIFQVKNINKIKKFDEYIGCTPEELLSHLENQFEPGMTWDNHGIYGWHIDHIIPLISAKTEEEIYKLGHYTNLQPLWAIDNLKKGSKLPK